MTKLEFIALLVANHKSGSWINTTVNVDGTLIGVKSFGKWVQRMQVEGKPYWSGHECKTVSAFKADVTDGVNYCLK